MNIIEISTIESRQYKFVLIRHADQVSIVCAPLFRGDEETKHKDLVEEFRQVHGLLAVERQNIQGGGMINVYPEYKIVSVGGRSMDFGKGDAELAANFIRDLFPEEWKIEITR